jgi:hypothetical protein
MVIYYIVDYTNSTYFYMVAVLASIYLYCAAWLVVDTILLLVHFCL